MKYNRYEIGPYNLHVINTDKFKKNVINVAKSDVFIDIQRGVIPAFIILPPILNIS